jgi:DNA-directed RNA polymerase subunit N (RpoN/RPB10)
MTYQLPMIECSSCGTHIGHLMENYYDFATQLITDINLNDGIPNLDNEYITVDGRDLKVLYLKTYYQWLKKNPNQNFYTPINVLQRALLCHVAIKEEDLPYAVEADGQRGLHEPRICCLRMFLCDPTTD